MTEIPINEMSGVPELASQTQEQIAGPIEGAPYEIASDEPAPEEDTRWDHDKAETLATVLRESGQYDRQINNRQSQMDYLNSDEGIENESRNERQNLDTAEQRLEKVRERLGDTDTDYVSEIAGRRDDAQAALDDKLSAIQEMAEKHKVDSLERVNNEFDEKLSPYEELYDINPEHFANMPTGEFMNLAEQYRARDHRLKTIERFNEYVTNKQAMFNNMHENQTIAGSRDVESMVGSISGALRMNKEQFKEVEGKYADVAKDSYYKADYQMMETYIALNEEYETRIRDSIQAVRDEQETFLNQFRPQPQEQQA